MRKRVFLRALEESSRRRRSELFVQLVGAVPGPLAILDVGGTMEYWRAVQLPFEREARIELLNTFEQQVAAPYKSVVGDARDLSRYGDGEFDVVFSNSVIGHVGSFSDQQLMASEMRRVGRYFFLQTPNHGFPLDWRTLVPFFHFLPVEVQAWCFERFSVGAYCRAGSRAEAIHWASRVRNIRRRELALLFPGGTVVHERFGGFTKSFIVHNLGPVPQNQPLT